MKRFPLAIAVGVWLAAWITAAQADVFVLKSGGRIEGDSISSAEALAKGYFLVDLASGGKLKLARSLVDRVERKSDTELEYEARLAKLEDTVDAHWEIARWCQDNGLRRQRELHLEQIIKHDPDDKEARYGLGYSQIGGKWVRRDEYMKSQGYIFYKNDWRLPHDVLLEQQAEAHKAAVDKWKKDLNIWRKWLDNRFKVDEGVANLRAVKDPLASSVLSEMFEDEKEPPVKLLLIELLGRMHTGIATTALVKASIEDEDPKIREAALKQLEEFGADVAVPVYIRGLDPEQQSNNAKINRAAVALARFKAQRAVKPLIDSLVTEHKINIGGNGPNGGLGIGLGFGGPGGGIGNFGVNGNKPKIVNQPIQNREVHSALRVLTGKDYQYDQEAWTRWYVESNTPKDVNLRRGE